MKAKIDYDSGYIKVYPKDAGDFGIVRMRGYSYKDDSHLRSMERDIQRHVDDVGFMSIEYEGWLCGECENYFDNKKDAELCCEEEK